MGLTLEDPWPYLGLNAGLTGSVRYSSVFFMFVKTLLILLGFSNNLLRKAEVSAPLSHGSNCNLTV